MASAVTTGMKRLSGLDELDFARRFYLIANEKDDCIAW